MMHSPLAAVSGDVYAITDPTSTAYSIPSTPQPRSLLLGLMVRAALGMAWKLNRQPVEA